MGLDGDNALLELSGSDILPESFSPATGPSL